MAATIFERMEIMLMKKFMLISIMLVLVPAAARAQGMPVYDAASYIQMLSQLEQMAKDYQKQLEQLDQAVKQTGALTGTRDMGSLLNGGDEASLRRYLPGSWQDILSMNSSQNESASGAQQIYQQLRATYNHLPAEEFIASDPEGPIAKAYERRTGTTLAAMSASEQAYNNIETRIETYEALLQSLNNTQDLKTSVDLLARISAENGFLLNEIIRLNAISMQQSAALDNEALTSYRRSATANKYDPEIAAQAFGGH